MTRYLGVWLDHSITSYINNVHPRLDHRFYTITNEILSSLIPMLNATLTSLKTPKLFTRRIDPEQRTSRESRPDPEPGPYRPLKSRARSEYLDKENRLHRSVHVDLQREFWDIGIQTIIQVSSVSLSPTNPSYPGEDWHVQGQLVRETRLLKHIISTQLPSHWLTRRS